MARRIVIALSILALLTVFVAGCSTRQAQQAQRNKLRGDLENIRTQGAKICAPREYASAEAHLDFAEEEWNERDFIRAQDHLVFAQESIEAARKWLAVCVETIPPDRDGDGVYDPDDACPDTPGLPEFKGCPDDDGDGIPNAEDKCPQEPGPKENEGCPDADGDGIFPPADKCPDQWGLAENDGCPQFIEITDTEIILKQKIHFDSGKSFIKPGGFPVLNEIASAIKGNEKLVVRIEGHTDSRGGHAKNMTLSQDRAESCRAYLIQQGVPQSRLTATGYGPDQPIASNNTPVGRGSNRRTEFKIISK